MVQCFWAYMSGLCTDSWHTRSTLLVKSSTSYSTLITGMNRRVSGPSQSTSCYTPWFEGCSGGLTLSNTLGSFLAVGMSFNISSASVLFFWLSPSSSVVRFSIVLFPCTLLDPTVDCGGDCIGGISDSLELGVILLTFLLLSRRVIFDGGTALGVGGGDGLGSKVVNNATVRSSHMSELIVEARLPRPFFVIFSIYKHEPALRSLRNSKCIE